MPTCCVPGCGNKSSDPSCVDNITFHRLPLNNKDILKYWIENLNLNHDNQSIADHRRVCSEHFDLQCFRQNSHTTKRCLLAGSIPHKFDPIAVNLLKGNIENNNNNNNHSEENMSHTCVVYGCKYRKKKNTSRGIQFHTFPLERERLHKWIEIINKHSLKSINFNNKHSRICQMHFVADDYVYRNDTNQSRYLKANAIPSLFEITDSISSVNNKSKQKVTKHQSGAESVPPLQQNTNVLNFTPNTNNKTTTAASSSSSSSSPNYEEYHHNENNEEQQLEIASDTDSSTSSSDDEGDDESGDSEYHTDGEDNDLEVDQTLEVDEPTKKEQQEQLLQTPQQNDALNTSNRSSNGSAKKRSGLSDVIDKLKQKSNTTSTSSLSSLLNNTGENESPQTASINAVIAAAQQTTPTCFISKKQQQQQQKAKQVQHAAPHVLPVNNKIVINQTNKSELDLYRLLERANLLQYFTIFTEKGGDDINQLCEADEDEFKEICELVGMASKPLHIKRLRKALDEYKHVKSECSNDSFDNPVALSLLPSSMQLQTTNLTILPKCNLNSPIANTNSTYDSAISTNSSNGNIPALINYSIKSQQFIQSQQPLQQQHQEEHEEEHDNDDSQYDSTAVHDLASAPYDYSGYNGGATAKKSRDHSSESSFHSDEASGDECGAGGADNSAMYVNNDTSMNGGENSFLYKSTGSADQNEKNIKKNRVVELYTAGERCVRKLSQQTGVPLTTVYRVIGKLKGINYNIPRGNGAGRKTILDAQDREILVEILQVNPRISRKALGKELEKRTGKSIHNSTLNRELCRLRHQGQNAAAYAGGNNSSNNNGDSSLNLTQSPSAQQNQKQHISSPPPPAQVTTARPALRQQQLAVETVNSPQPQLSSSSSSLSTTSSTTSSYMAKDLIATRKEQEQHQNKPLALVNATNRVNNSSTPPPPPPSLPQPSLLTPSAVLAALASNPLAARLPFLAQMQQSPFNNLNALAAYSSYFTGAGGDLSQAFNQYNPAMMMQQQQPPAATPPPSFQIDSEHLRLISNEARKLSDTMSKSVSMKPLNNMKPEIAAQIMELINGSFMANDKTTRDETIRRLISALTRFDSVDKTYYDYCSHEANVQLCILKPVLLTRIEDLIKMSKQLLKNLGIVEQNSVKRVSMGALPADLSINNNKRAKIATTTDDYRPPAESMYPNAMSVYNTYLQQQQQQQQPSAASSPSSTTSSLWSAREERLESIKLELQESVRQQEALRTKLVQLTTHPEHDEKTTYSYLIQLQSQLSEESKKCAQLIDEQKRIEKQLKRKKTQKSKKSSNNVYQHQTPHIQQHDDGTNDTTTNDVDENYENERAIAGLKHNTGDYNNEEPQQHHNSNEDENINVDDEYDEDDQS